MLPVLRGAVQHVSWVVQQRVNCALVGVSRSESLEPRAAIFSVPVSGRPQLGRTADEWCTRYGAGEHTLKAWWSWRRAGTATEMHDW